MWQLNCFGTLKIATPNLFWTNCLVALTKSQVMNYTSWKFWEVGCHRTCWRLDISFWCTYNMFTIIWLKQDLDGAKFELYSMEVYIAIHYILWTQTFPWWWNRSISWAGKLDHERTRSRLFLTNQRRTSLHEALIFMSVRLKIYLSVSHV